MFCFLKLWGARQAASREPVCQQSAHPREVFKQKERALSATSVSSPQPGEMSLWDLP